VLIFLSACHGHSLRVATYGSPVTGKSLKQVELARVLESPDEYSGRTIEIRGEVVEVCQRRGCWIRMAPTGSNDKQGVFVKFTCPIEGERLIPMTALGQPVRVEGTLIVETISEAERRHYASDAGATSEEIGNIVGSATQIRIASGAAHVEGIEVTPES
jgi:RecJ-like exonuclease